MNHEHVFNVMGGFMIAVGAVTAFLAWRFLSRHEPGTFATLLVAGAASVALMSATNFLLHSNFRWLLLLPALLCMMLFLSVGYKSYPSIRSPPFGSGLSSNALALSASATQRGEQYDVLFIVSGGPSNPLLTLN